MTQPWALVEVVGGCAELDTSDDVQTFVIDWDNVKVDPEYAASKREELAQAASCPSTASSG